MIYFIGERGYMRNHFIKLPWFADSYQHLGANLCIYYIHVYVYFLGGGGVKLGVEVKILVESIRWAYIGLTTQ